MYSYLLRITIMTFVMVGCLANSLEVTDDKIKINIEAIIPKNVKIAKFKVEYELSIPCVYKSCRDVPSTSGSGIYTIDLYGEHKQVYCEINPDGTKYLVIQRRINGSESFYRNWTEYENGFGNLEHEFWIGNKALHLITSLGSYKLRVDLEAFDLTKAYAEYNQFYVESPEQKYTLHLKDYSGTAGDSMSIQSEQKFSTFDQDNDLVSDNCAVLYKGAWWYRDCHSSNLNGFYYPGHHDTYADGIDWEAFRGYHESMKTATMKII